MKEKHTVEDKDPPLPLVVFFRNIFPSHNYCNSYLLFAQHTVAVRVQTVEHSHQCGCHTSGENPVRPEASLVFCGTTGSLGTRLLCPLPVIDFFFSSIRASCVGRNNKIPPWGKNRSRCNHLLSRISGACNHLVSIKRKTRVSRNQLTRKRAM